MAIRHGNNKLWRVTFGYLFSELAAIVVCAPNV